MMKKHLEKNPVLELDINNDIWVQGMFNIIIKLLNYSYFWWHYSDNTIKISLF